MGLPSNHSLRSRLLVIAAAFAIGSASLAPAQDLSRQATANGPSNAETQDKIGAEAPFLKENDAAMTKMMNDMTIKPSGDVDRDFVAMMVPHHQGAIDMAQAELRYGHNEQLLRIAQEIIVDQIQQISLMRLAVGEPLPPSVSSPTDSTSPRRGRQ
jgi:uncharacterized protein (DUF305 family)